MKNYHILECDNREQIAIELKNFLQGPNGPLSKNITKFWNFFDKKEVARCISDCPTLMRWLKSLDLRVREMSFTMTTKKIKTSPHIDAPPVVAKINFPVSNTKDTFNVWFDDQNKEIDRVECVHPIVLRSNVKHTVEIGPKAVLPRIQVSFCFYNEPIKYLE